MTTALEPRSIMGAELVTRPDQPIVIQGGMGVAVSGWPLAKAVSTYGDTFVSLGNGSGVALNIIMAAKLLEGDQGGYYRRALSHFPFPEISQMVLDAFYIEEGNPRNIKGRGIPKWTVDPPRLLTALTICANYALIWLAKEGHTRQIGINYLEKLAMSTVAAITGAMLAGVDRITMGAGIPYQIPDVIDAIAEGRIVKYEIPVAGSDVPAIMKFDPEAFFGEKLPPMNKPGFYPIVASNTLAAKLAKMLRGRIAGLIFEEPTAGGHNAPPRGKLTLGESGEPVYGERDLIDYKKVVDLGLPFWIGGSMASPERLKEALSKGATGIQVGTAFALCEESGMFPYWKSVVRRMAYNGSLRVRTDPIASPTGYPFKVAQVPDTMSDEATYIERERECLYGALQTLYNRPDGTIGYRCPAEPVDSYIDHGGSLEDADGRQCICQGLKNTAMGGIPIITLGDDVNRLMPLLMKNENSSFGVADVLRYLGV